MQLKLSENIKKYRKDMSLTQEALAEVLGVTVGAVSKWENGNNVPDVLMMMGTSVPPRMMDLLIHHSGCQKATASGDQRGAHSSL